MDKLFDMFFDLPRWEKAIDKGLDKDIRRDQLIKLADDKHRLALAAVMKEEKFRISPPHTAQIPKDNGEFRTVYVNEPMDRVWLSIANDLLFDTCHDMIHTACKSYQIGIGCGKVVKEVSRTLTSVPGCKGWKADLSKYFDSVPLRYIDAAFDKAEERCGKSCVITALRQYYHEDMYFDENNSLCHKFQSLKQGCAVAAWLANVILYHIDQELSELDGFYVRYSDDMLFVGPDAERAMTILTTRLEEMDMKLNPKKVEAIDAGHWFKFLGYSIKGKMITLSPTRIKTFQKEIQRRTVRGKRSFQKALGAVNRYLYKGNGEYSWATQILGVCNVDKDIHTLNQFVMDCLRAVQTGKKKTGGLGYVPRPDCCIDRGRGRNVAANRKTGRIDGYLSLKCMQNALCTSREAYMTLVATL